MEQTEVSRFSSGRLHNHAVTLLGGRPMAFASYFDEETIERWNWRTIAQQVRRGLLILAALHFVIGALALWAGYVTPYLIVSTLGLLVAANITLVVLYLRNGHSK